MPEWTLYRDGNDERAIWRSLDEFTKGYIQAALFSGLSEEDWSKVGAGVYGCDLSALHPDAIECAKIDCERFQRDHGTLLDALLEDEPRRDLESAGMDFWYTRQGHGVGFWESGRWANYKVADKLSDICKAYPERTLEVGDDRKVHIW